MVNAQEYLNKVYSKEIAQIDLNDKNLTGELIIENFPNLEKVECRNNKGITSIKLINLPKLDYFHANNCQIDSLIVNNNCPNITFFNVANNNLSDTKFLGELNSEKLSVLSLHTNNLPEQGLEIFSKFKNLEQLFLDNCDEERFKKGEYNKFTGSLKPLQNLTKLELLSIGNTNIDSGLEYLPASFRKIGLNTSWWERDTSCSKLRYEIEKTVEIKEITEKLKSEQEMNSKGKKDPAWFSDYYRIAPWRDAQKLGRAVGGKAAQKWLEDNYPNGERKAVTFLNMNGKNLEGDLDLEGFTNLKKLDCSFNQLISLNLSNCQNLTHLNCSWNKLNNTDFLKTIPNKEKLKVLRINNNEKLKESLEWLKDLVGLSSLSLENSPFFGSLEPLRRLNNLEKVFISNTHITEGLEYLPTSCKELYCATSDQKYKSIKITNELSKFYKNGYYEISKWKEDKENDNSSKVIPLERLFVIRSNIQQFLKKWGDKDKKNRTEISKLQPPEQFQSFRYLQGVEWASTAATVTGGAITLLGEDTAGGVITLIAPLIGAGTSQLKVSLYDEKENKWNDFKKDADTLLDNYNELYGILKQIEVGKLGIVNGVLKDLNDKVNSFLEEYDDDGNEEIEMDELINERERFVEGGLEKLEEIIKSTKRLEEEVINYRQGSASEKEIKQREKIKSIIDELDKSTEKRVAGLANKIQAVLPQREITQIIYLISLGQKGKKQTLVISRDKKGLFGFFKPDKRKYILDMIEYKEGEAVKVRDNKEFPKWFNSEGEINEWAKNIEWERKVNKTLRELKKEESEEGINNEIKTEELINIIEQELRKKEEGVSVSELTPSQALESAGKVDKQKYAVVEIKEDEIKVVKELEVAKEGEVGTSYQNDQLINQVEISPNIK